jgi:hypothetical protein
MKGLYYENWGCLEVARRVLTLLILILEVLANDPEVLREKPGFGGNFEV